MKRFLEYGRTLLIGAIGALIFDLLHIPLAWMLGAMTAVLIMRNVPERKLPALKINVHPNWRNGALLVIGCMIGTSFTAESISALWSQLPSMFITNILLLLFCLLIGWWGAKWSGMSMQSGMIGNVPGGLTQMVMLGEEVKGADMTSVAVMQTIRVMAVIFIVPVWVVHGISRSSTGAGTTVQTQDAAPFLEMPWPSWGILLSCLLVCFIGAWCAGKLRFPTPYLLGPVFVTAFWGGVGLPIPVLPELILIVAQLFIGCYVGYGMKFDHVASLKKLVSLSIIASVLAVLFSLVLGYGLTVIYSMSISTAFLSMAPGGMAEMGLTASLIGADLPTVSSYQLFRILFILFIVPPLLRWLLVKRR